MARPTRDARWRGPWPVRRRLRLCVLLLSIVFVAAPAALGAQTTTTPATTTPTTATQAATTPTTTAPTTTTGPVLQFSHNAQIGFILAVVGVFAALWFSLLLFDRISAARWRRSDTYGNLLSQLVDKAFPASPDAKATADEVRFLASAISEPPRGAKGLTRSVLALGLLTLVGVAMVVLLVGNSSNAGDLLKTVVTALLTALTTIVGFYFGAKAVQDVTERPTGGGTAPRPQGPPGVPTEVNASPGPDSGTALVSFKPPADAGGSAISSYTATSDPDGKTGEAATSPITVPGLTAGVEYTFTVRATNAAGKGPASAPSTGLTLAPAASPPGPPTGVAATAGADPGSAVVSFAAPSDDGGAPITGYTATSSPDGLTGSGAASPLTVKGLTSGTQYTFTVRAANSAGDGPESAPSAPVAAS
jgi:hypothetical protein